MKIPTQLKTDRLIIRRVIARDVEPFTQFLLDEKATQYLNFTPEQKTSATAQAMIDGTVAGYDTDNAHYILAITGVETKQFVGMLGGQSLEADGEFEIFYNLLPEYWGKGYSTQAVMTLLDYLKHESEYTTAVAFIHIGNAASIKLAQRLNMTNEGQITHEGTDNYRYTYSLSE